jgi:hypothetical protein
MAQEYSPSEKPRTPGTYSRYDGASWKCDGETNRPGYITRYKSAACFALWTGIKADKLAWYPRVHGMQFDKTAEECYEYAVNNVYRKVFKGMPTWNALRRSHSCRVVADLRDETMVEINFRWRVLRALHEAPSDLSSCAAIANLAPDLEAPWVLGLAAVGDWSRLDGNTVARPHTVAHRTYHSSYESGNVYSLARCFAHIQEHGRLFAGPLAKQYKPAYHKSYGGVTELTSGNSMLRVEGLSEVKHIRDAKTCIELMRRVRDAHLKKPSGTIRPKVYDLLPAVNEDDERQRIW